MCDLITVLDGGMASYSKVSIIYHYKNLPTIKTNLERNCFGIRHVEVIAY